MGAMDLGSSVAYPDEATVDVDLDIRVCVCLIPCRIVGSVKRNLYIDASKEYPLA